MQPLHVDEHTSAKASTSLNGREPWHARDAREVLREFETTLERGLTTEQIIQRRARHGYNELPAQPPPTLWRRLFDQFNNFVVIILIAASLISALLGDWVEAAAILAIVGLNAVLGVIQERRAEAALAALQKLAAPEAHVVRDGHRQTIPARELVPGDVVLLEAGNYLPADVRLIESVNLRVDEAMLTGESAAVEKHASLVLDAEIPLGDRRNTAYMGTLVTYGRGRGVVTAIGAHTEVGLIARMLHELETEPTPLQKRLDQLGKTLGWAALAVCGVVLVVGIVRGHNPLDMFLVAVSLAIAAVPEGLPAVVTVTLALGMREMIRRHALIRRLPAVETLGSATAICSDKTGTLTQNEMTVTRLWAGGESLTVSGEGYRPVGKFCSDGHETDLSPTANTLLWAGMLCNDAVLEVDELEDAQPGYHLVGDATEGALLVAAAKAGLWRSEFERAYPRLAEAPFDAERKCMSTLHELRDPQAEDPSPFQESDRGRAYVVCAKGAPDVILGLCSRILRGGESAPLTAADWQTILAENAAMAHEALRVIGVAIRTLTTLPETITAETVERDLTFVGLMGMMDPPRPEVKAAIDKARRAGMDTYMITGDYPETARAIASLIGLGKRRPGLLTGAQVDALDDAALDDAVKSASIFARVSPHHKMRIVESLKRLGHVVAMTGDGVNDAPALKRADIGVAMGITGTDVAKETAAMVLTDDNYASIVAAIEQGRIIYANIRKFVYYLLSCNIAEIVIIFLGTLLGWDNPLTAIQLLWLNLMTDGAPALALALEKGDPDVMDRRPRPVNEPIINRPMLVSAGVLTVVLTAVVLFAFRLGFRWGGVAQARTMAFLTLALAELPIAYTARSERFPLMKLGVFTNRWMQVAVSVSVALLLAVVYVPFLRQPFNTVALPGLAWLVMLPLIFLPALAAETVKGIRRWREGRTTPR